MQSISPFLGVGILFFFFIRDIDIAYIATFQHLDNRSLVSDLMSVELLVTKIY